MELNFLNDSQIEELQMMSEIIHEMVIADGFSDLDSCLKKHPDHLEIYNRHACASLRAIRRVQGLPPETIMNEIGET